ncbi:hypothetical protein [Paenibacillus apiarius]|uniref:hypothetical protein n=1 Tax=Paenibacillus apiarius TaxID=46240 RepID=UPI001F09AAFE|nr:hypothetical protein [Paenibacillus apiarius]
MRERKSTSPVSLGAVRRLCFEFNTRREGNEIDFGDMRLKPALLPRFRSALGPSELMHKRILYEEMLTIVRFFTGRLITQLAGTPIVIVISDENGCELDMAGDETMQQLAAARHRSGSAIHRRSMRNEQHHSCEDI